MNCFLFFVYIGFASTMFAAITTEEVDSSAAMELIEILLDFVDSTKEPQLKRLIQFVCGLLNTSKSENLNLASKLIRKLFLVIIHSPKDDRQLQIYNPQLVSDFLLCVQMSTNRFPEEGQFLLTQLCSITSNNDTQLLEHIFDDILHELGPKCIESSKLYCRVRKLLESKNNEERHSGYLILNKLLHSTSSENLDLYSYISIMECLKTEHKSISLSLVREKNIDGIWMRKLYMQLLQNKNIQMRYVIIDFIMEHFTIAELFNANLLIEFLSATNCPELHNLEGCHLQPSKMKKFATLNDNKQFLKAVADVAWTGLPLHRWLNSLDPKHQPQIKKNLLLRLAAHVRNIENLSLRNSALNLFCDLFEVTIESLSLHDFMTFVQTLHQENDNVCGLLIVILQKIIENCDDIKEQIVYFTKSNYEIFSDAQNNNNLWSPLMELLGKLESVPTNLHGWWRLPAFFTTFHSEEAKEFFHAKYYLNYDWIEECKDLNKLQQYLIDKLSCQTPEEINFVKERSMHSFLAKNVHHWSQLDEFNLNPINILEIGSFNTLSYMASLLEQHDKKLPDDKLIEFFLEQLYKYSRRWINPGKILNYISKYQDPNETISLVQKMISNSNDGWELGGILHNTKYVLQPTLINGLLFSEIPSGVKRMESAYLNSLSTWNTVEFIKQSNYIAYVSNMKTGKIDLFNELLNIIYDISQREIVENSRDHRLQIRFIRAILHQERFGAPLPEYWNDKLWDVLLNPRNLLNIKFLYECLVAKLVPTFEQLKKQLLSLSSLQPDQQDSIISVAHTYCMCRWDTLNTEQLESIFELLLVNSVNFRTMLFSQLVLRRLADKCEMSSIEVPLVGGQKANLALLIDDKNLEFQTDARLMLPKMVQDYNIADAILYITNAPFDEYENPKWLFSQDELNKLRNEFKSKSLQV